MNILRLVLLGLAALAGIIVGAALLHKAIYPETSPRTVKANVSPEAIEATRRALERKLFAVPEYAAFFERLKSVFPQEYESFFSTVSRRAALSGNLGSEDSLFSEATRTLRLSRGILAAKADKPALDHIFEMQLAVLHALAAKDRHLCVDFLYGGEDAGFFEFSAQNRGLIAAMAIAGIDAIHDGEIKRVERPAPTDADFETLEKALFAQGLNTSEIEALLDGKASDPPIDDAEMCRAGQVYLETLAAMPEEERMRIYGLAVELMARS